MDQLRTPNVLGPNFSQPSYYRTLSLSILPPSPRSLPYGHNPRGRVLRRHRHRVGGGPDVVVVGGGVVVVAAFRGRDRLHGLVSVQVRLAISLLRRVELTVD